MGQINEQQRHFNEWLISELPGEVDSIQTVLTTFYPLAIMECRLCLQALCVLRREIIIVRVANQ
jgi:hypothetical protein